MYIYTYLYSYTYIHIYMYTYAFKYFFICVYVYIYLSVGAWICQNSLITHWIRTQIHKFSSVSFKASWPRTRCVLSFEYWHTSSNIIQVYKNPSVILKNPSRMLQPDRPIVERDSVGLTFLSRLAPRVQFCTQGCKKQKNQSLFETQFFFGILHRTKVRIFSLQHLQGSTAVGSGRCPWPGCVHPSQ